MEDFIRVDVRDYVNKGIENGDLAPFWAIKYGRVRARRGNLGEIVNTYTDGGILEKENEFLSVAIKSLPSRQQQIIRYIFYQGHTLYEASKMLKIHYQSAYDLKRRALKRLKKIITKQFYD